MARKATSTPAVGQPTITAEKALPLIQNQIRKAEDLIARGQITSDEKSQWALLTRNILEKAFGENQPNVQAVMNAGSPMVIMGKVPESTFYRRRAEDMTTMCSRMQALIELLETETQLQAGVSPKIAASMGGHKVFLVHGHDEASLSQVGRFLEKLGQEVVILREQPNQGRTVIEKFEEFSDVGFAVILLTPDDEGRAKSSPDFQSRARQNVILELGFFIGRLGRSRVCPLYVSGVEIPSDYAGVIYTAMDGAGAWRWELAKELKSAGFPIDMNLVL